MIPKPKSEKSRDFDPSRWVCCKKPEKCDGNFRVYGQNFPCLLRKKCILGAKNDYQWSYGRRSQGRYPLLAEHFNHRAVWNDRRNGLMRAFCSDYLAEKRKINRQRHGKEYDRKYNEKRAKKREQERPKLLEEWAKRGIFPCGEDCFNCPFEDCVVETEE